MSSFESRNIHVKNMIESMIVLVGAATDDCLAHQICV